MRRKPASMADRIALAMEQSDKRDKRRRGLLILPGSKLMDRLMPTEQPAMATIRRVLDGLDEAIEGQWHERLGDGRQRARLADVLRRAIAEVSSYYHHEHEIEVAGELVEMLKSTDEIEPEFVEYVLAIMSQAARAELGR